MRTSGLALLLPVLACSPAPAPRSAPAAPHDPATVGFPDRPPAMPAEVTVCERDDTAGVGEFVPSEHDLVLAARALPELCLAKATREAAVVACARRLGHTKIKLGTGTESAERRCWESFVPVSAGPGRWVALHVLVYSGEGRFAGSGAAVELGGDSATLVLVNEWLAASCNSADTLPPDTRPAIGALDAQVRSVLCGFGR